MGAGPASPDCTPAGRFRAQPGGCVHGGSDRSGEDPHPDLDAGKDAAPYLSCITVSRDADTGIQNMATYRAMVKDKNHLAVNIAPGPARHHVLRIYIRKNRPAPFAWVVAAEPVVHLGAVANVPYGVDEATISGG